MDSEELVKNISTIFHNEAYIKRCRKDSKVIRSDKGTQLDISPPHTNTGNLHTTYRNFTIEYENFDLLLKLYEQAQDDEILVDKFLFFLGKNIKKSSVSRLCVETLIKIGEFYIVTDQLTELWLANKFNDIVPFLPALNELLYWEPNLFGEEELEELEELLKDILKSSPTAYQARLLSPISGPLERIHNIQYQQLKMLLGDVTNIQINTDKNRVKQLVTKYQFDEKLSEALDKVDQYYFSKAHDEFEYSMAIAPLREFFQLLMEDIANKIFEITNEDIPTSEATAIANRRLYVKRHLHLDEENQLLNKLIEMINHEGSHALISDKEYLRLTKNMSIELALLLLTKVGKFINEYQ